jgi:two-component system, OmpR family, response regulator
MQNTNYPFGPASDPFGVVTIPLSERQNLCDDEAQSMRALVVEDDEKIASFVSKGLKQNGFAVDCASDGEQGLDLASTITYDIAVLDLMLPKLDGLSLLRRLRQQKVLTPVLILSARASVDDRVVGLQSGGDDYVTKPFAFSELLARVQALIRRASQSQEPTQLTVADLSMNLVTREVSRNGETIDLHPREFSLLEFLLRHVGRPVTKTMILEHIWDFHFDPQTNVVDVLIHRLRAKVDRGFPIKLIHTIRGVGYVIKAG